MTPDPQRAGFVALFARDADPWAFKTSFYEARKRALTLACLPDARYRRAYEPGCANGELTAALATRCDHLVGSDGVPAAVAEARTRLADQAHVAIIEAWIPEGWPDGDFDLIVLSEIGYFLSADELQRVIAAAKQSLANGGTLLACHWRHPIDGYPLDALAVHGLLDAHLGLHRLLHHEEVDLLLDVWSTDGRGAAERERTR